MRIRRVFQTSISKRYLLVVSVAALATVSVMRHGGSAAAERIIETDGTAPAMQQEAQAQGQSEFIRAIRVFVHPEDIYPAVVSIKPGKIRLVVENETQSEVSLVVERVNPGQGSQRVTSVRTVNHGKRNREDITFGAGEYVLYEESRPQQQSRIIVDPHDQ